MSAKKYEPLSDQETLQKKESKDASDFSQPNLTLQNQSEILEFYSEKSKFLNGLENISQDQIELHTVNIVVEILFYLKADPHFLTSKAYEYISLNLSNFVIDINKISVVLKVLEKEVEVDFSLVPFETEDLQKIAEACSSEPKKIVFFKNLMSQDQIDRSQKEAVLAFFDVVESIDLAQKAQALSSEKIQKLLHSDSSADFLRMAFLNLDTFDTQIKQNFLNQVKKLDITNLVDCAIALTKSEKISSEIFQFLVDLDFYFIKLIIHNYLKADLFELAFPYFKDIWSKSDIMRSLIDYTDQDIIQTEFGFNLFSQLIDTNEDELNFLSEYFSSRGLHEFLSNEQVRGLVSDTLRPSKDWFINFFTIIRYSRKNSSHTVPEEFGEIFELPESISFEDIAGDYHSEKDLQLPEKWQKIIASQNLTQADATRLFFRIAYGRKESIIGIGGIDLYTKVIEYNHNENTLIRALDDCVERGWARTPNEIQELFTNHKWEFFPEILFETNDIKTIALVAANSKATVADISSYTKENDVGIAIAFFKGCSRSDIKAAANSEVFQKEFSEYVDYINTLTALGEQAMVVRCAAKGISLTEVGELINLARVQKYTTYKTTAFLTGIHYTDIYWEDRQDRTIEGLYWDPELKKYVDERLNERISVKQLTQHILMNADPQNYESVFFLLNLAQEDSNSLLRDGEQVSVKDYKYIFDSFVGRSDSSIEILKELGARAGYVNPQDYEQALVDSLNGYPSAESLGNILELSQGTITTARFKELSYSYLDTDIRFSADACKVLFKYAQDIEDPYKKAEKLKFWDKFRGDFSEKDNIATLGANEVKIFLDEEVIDTKEARKLVGEYIVSGQAKITELQKLFEYTINSQAQVEELLQLYVKSSTSLELPVLKAFNSLVTDEGYKSEAISSFFSQYIEQEISFDYLVSYLDTFASYVTPEQVKNKVLQIAIAGETITNELLDLMKVYQFDTTECQTLCEVALSKHTISAKVFKELHTKAQYSEGQSLDFIKQILIQEDAQIAPILEYLCQSVTVERVHEIAIEYAVSYKKVDKQYLNTLKNVINAVNPELLKIFNESIRERDSRVTFFDDSELMQAQYGAHTLSTNYTEIYKGLPAVELEDGVQHLEENRVFFVNNLVFSENKGKFSAEALTEILGNKLASQLATLKQSVAQSVVERDDNWMLEREAAFSRYKVLSHGTGQAQNRNKGVARQTEEDLNAQSVVKAIVNGSSGVGIRGEKATLGAFFNPGANGLYGGVDSGSAVLFFIDDLLKSHITVASDPMGADGHVGVDSESNKYVQIPNRVLFNPQEGEIEGVSLNHGQMGNYILELRNMVENKPELLDLVFQTATNYLQEKHPQSIAVLRKIHTVQRQQGYPEASILWARDYYLSIRLSDSESDQKLAGVVEKIVLGISSGLLEGDLRSYIDMVSLNWDSDLEELSNNPLGLAQLLSAANQKMQQRQRGRFTTAARQLKSRKSKAKSTRTRSGVAKQHMLQVKSAEKYGDVQPRNITDNLRTTRALFMDTEDSTSYVAALTEVKDYAEYMQAVKESALLRTYQEGIDSLSQVDKVTFDRYQRKISLCSSGSIGRGEVVISSDIDYLVLVDDSELEDADVEKIKRVLFKIGETMNQKMIEDFNIRPDAGLANKDRQPIILYSKVNSFSLDKSGSRQVLEPSEMMDIVPVDGKEELVTNFKSRFITRAAELIAADDSISLYEYMDSKVASFDTLFTGGFSQLLSRDQLIDFKMQVQRIFNFYLYKMVAERIPELSNSSDIIPNKTLDKIKFMAEKKYISQELSARFSELQLLLYRLRYRADVLNSAQLVQIQESQGKVEERAKIAAKLDPQEISQQELSRFIELISFFSEKLQDTGSVQTGSQKTLITD